jgi:lipopolysaccharide transport system permease protein
MFFAFALNKYDRATIRLLAEREVRSRIAGTYLGFGHYVLLPVLMLLVYAFVFSVVFSVRWPNAEDTFGSFALRAFAGLIPFQFFAEVVNRAPGLVLENPTYVKKVVFPLETLVPTAISVALFSTFVTSGVFLVAYIWSYGLPPVTALWWLVLWPPLILITAGFAWGLASLGVFLRDLRQLVAILTSILIFLAPVFYPLSMVPKPFEPLILANPVSYLIEAMRAAIFDAQSPSLAVFTFYLIGSVVLAQTGYWGFMRCRKAFADVM